MSGCDGPLRFGEADGEASCTPGWRGVGCVREQPSFGGLGGGVVSVAGEGGGPLGEAGFVDEPVGFGDGAARCEEVFGVAGAPAGRIAGRETIEVKLHAASLG